jgi:hypothetical protein
VGLGSLAPELRAAEAEDQGQRGPQRQPQRREDKRGPWRRPGRQAGARAEGGRGFGLCPKINANH